MAQGGIKGGNKKKASPKNSPMSQRKGGASTIKKGSMLFRKKNLDFFSYV